MSSQPRTRTVEPRYRNPRPMAAGVDIGHVHLRAADLARIRAFYVDILGFDVTVDMPSALFVSAGGYHHTLGFNTWESKGGPQARPAPPACTTSPSATRPGPTFGDALRRLLEADWPVDGANDHGTHEAIYLRDPEGNGLELCWDRPEEEWPVNAEGHLAFTGRKPDLEGLLREGAAALLSARPGRLGRRSGPCRRSRDQARRLVGGAGPQERLGHDPRTVHRDGLRKGDDPGRPVSGPDLGGKRFSFA